jgi:hypothetical protein
MKTFSFFSVMVDFGKPHTVGSIIVEPSIDCLNYCKLFSLSEALIIKPFSFGNSQGSIQVDPPPFGFTYSSADPVPTTAFDMAITEATLPPILKYSGISLVTCQIVYTEDFQHSLTVQ